MYRFERVSRSTDDAVLYAVLLDNGARNVVIVCWHADDWRLDRIMEFDFGDQTKRLDAIDVATKMTRMYAKGEPRRARTLFEASRFYVPPPLLDEPDGAA
jgi:hypothetical protein